MQAIQIKFFSNLSDDVRWTIIGTTKYSNTYTCKADIVERLFTPLTAQLDGFITNTILNTIAEDNYVVLQKPWKHITNNN